MGDRIQGPDSDEFYARYRAAVGDRSLHSAFNDCDKQPPIIHTCADGHSWREQPDGGVSPSWGMALTSIKYPGWHPRCCPQPELHQAPGDWPALLRGVRCPECEEIALPFDIYPGISCTPWTIVERFREIGHICQPPEPTCGKPPVSSRKWAKTTLAGADGKRYQGYSWVPIDLESGVAAGEQIGLFA
jgi:hypothetical protein